MTPSSHPRGRDAASPTEIPAAGWWEVLKRTWSETSEDNLGLVAAGVAFYFFLALVPLLGALVMAYGLVADPQTVVHHVQSLAAMLPADAARLIGRQLMDVVRSAEGSRGLGVLVALFLSLYGAMRGASAVMGALNIVYEQKETRGFVKTTLIAFAMTAGVVLIAILAIVAVTLLGYVDRLLTDLSPALHWLVRVASWLLLGAIASLAISAVYRYGPDRYRARWSWLTPGSTVATLLWLVATLGFGFYVSNFGSYNATYGSLGAVVVLLLWLWLSAFVLLLGGQLNAELEHQTARDTTAGPEKPMGQRGASMADRVA